MAAGDEHVPCPVCAPFAHGSEAERRRAPRAQAPPPQRGRRLHAERLGAPAAAQAAAS